MTRAKHDNSLSNIPVKKFLTLVFSKRNWNGVPVVKKGTGTAFRLHSSPAHKYQNWFIRDKFGNRRTNRQTDRLRTLITLCLHLLVQQWPVWGRKTKDIDADIAKLASECLSHCTLFWW